MGSVIDKYTKEIEKLKEENENLKMELAGAYGAAKMFAPQIKQQLIKEFAEDKEYLIAYISGYNGNILTEKVCAESQKNAMYKFGLDNANCDIIAITLMEK